MSESTRDYDRGEKFLFYRTLSSFEEYILIDQYDIHIEQFAINDAGKWVLTEYNSNDNILKFSKIDFQLPVKDIYNRVEFETEER